jgi:carboxyl-terminal PDZ ligand of neuronal nitric oxide synthase protein
MHFFCGNFDHFASQLFEKIINHSFFHFAFLLQPSLSMYLQDQSDMILPLRNAFSTANTPNNNQLNQYGSISHQLSALSKQLGTYQYQQPQSIGGGNYSLQNTLTSLNQLQNINQTMNSLSQNNDLKTQQELYQINQELLNRLQNLNFGYPSNNNNNGSSSNMFANQNSPFGSNTSSNNTNNNNHSNNSLNNNSNNNNMLNSPSSMGNLTPSPMGTLNRSQYSISPLDDASIGLSMDKSLDSLYDSSLFIKPLSQVSTLTTLDAEGKVKVIVPMSNAMGDSLSPESPKNRRQQATTPIMRRADKKVSLPGHVTLRVTDECGNVTNSRRLPATPAFITRTTSEKVPNRSQMMSQVQRTQWARHTTK